MPENMLDLTAQPHPQHQAAADIARQERLLDKLEEVGGKPAPPPNPEKEAAIAAQQKMETTLGQEIQTMLDRLQPVSLQDMPAEYDDQRLQTGLALLRDPNRSAAEKRIIREHLNDVLGRIGGIEFLARQARL